MGHPYVSSEEINELIKTTPPDQVMEKSAERIGWSWQKLDNANLEEKLTEQQIFQLLSMRDDDRYPVLHSLIEGDPTSTVKLLKQITNEDQFTQLIFVRSGWDQHNSLSWAVANLQSDVVRYICTRLNKYNLYKLLHVQDRDGDTALHTASWQDYPLDELLEPFTATESHELLSVRNSKGQTVLSYFIYEGKFKTFQSLINIYSERKSELLDLATISDNKGNTSFHYAVGSDSSDYLTVLIQATLSLKIRGKVAAALEKKNAKNAVVGPHWYFSKPFPANRFIYQWILDSTKNRQYLLFDYPKVLVISNEADRNGSKEEAIALINCFQSLGFKVDAKPIKKKLEMRKELKEASKSQSGLIVAILSHGMSDFIQDNEGERIDIEEIEESMTYHDRNTPKCLILQCCQNSAVEQPSDTNRNPIGSVGLQNDATYRAEQLAIVSSRETTLTSEITPGSEETSLVEPLKEDANSSNKGIAAYVPTSRHLCVFMSTVPGQLSQRNQFIPALVKAVEQLEPNESISEAFTVAVEELFLELPAQKFFFLSTLMQKFCIKNTLPLVVKRAGVNDEGVMPNLDYPVPEVHHMLSNNQSSSLIFLLDQVTSPHHLLSIVQLKDLYFRLNFFSNALARNSLAIYKYLMRRLHRDDLFVLLCEQGRGGWTGLHCAVDQNDPLSEIFSLLNDEAKVYHLLSIRDHEGQTALSFSIAGWKEVSFQSIMRHYSYDQSKLMELASIKDVRGNTSFHYAAGKQTANFLIPLLKSVDLPNHRVMFIRDGQGLTVLSYCIYWNRMDAFQAIISHYTRKHSKLLELAAITDNAGNTSFHYAAGQETSRFLIDLIKFTCSSDTRAQLAKVLSLRDHYNANCTLGRIINYCHPDNQLICDWAFDSITNNRYLLCDLPSVLIFYATAGRSNAETEAQTFINSLKSLGLSVKPVKDFTMEQLFAEIESTQNSHGQNGQIVALMSHGVNGAIIDNNGKKISLRGIELEMYTCNDTPKLLILQCCQRGIRQTNRTVPTQTVEEMACVDEKKASLAQKKGQVKSGASAQSGEMTESVGVDEDQIDGPEECETPQMCTGDISDSGYDTYFPTSRHFSVLTSCSPYKPSVRNRFIPALGEALIKLKLNENMATLMMPVKRSVREVSKGMQAPSLIDLLEFDFCIKNILPIYLSFKRETDREREVFPPPGSLPE